MLFEVNLTKLFEFTSDQNFEQKFVNMIFPEVYCHYFLAEIMNRVCLCHILEGT